MILGMFKKNTDESVVSMNPACGMLMATPRPRFRKVIQGDPEGLMRDRAFLLKCINEHPKYKDISEEHKQQAIDQEVKEWLHTQATSKVEIKKYPKEERKQSLYSTLRKLTGI